MGKTLLILLAGFAVSFGILAQNKNRRYIDSVDRMVNQVSDYSAKNASTSGAQKALNQLYLDPAWRGSYNNLAIAGGTANITVVNDSAGAAPKAHQVKIRSTSSNTLTEVVVFDSEFHEFAVWAKDTVINVTTQDSVGIDDPDLLMQNAPFMPKIDKDGLFSEAWTQSHLYSEDEESHFHPDDGFPSTGGFYYDSTSVPKVANVIYVDGNLHIRKDRTVYGIFIVEGNVLLNENAHIKGVLYLPNASSRVYNHENASSQVTGGIVTWGEVDGDGYQIIVRHQPEYLRALISDYAPNNPPIRVLTWK
ncbi:MAG: hypothetical protein ACRENG_31800 [bacterium]